MKKIYSIVSAALLTLGMNAQVFESDLSNWAGGVPTDFDGPHQNLVADSITQINSGNIFGTSSAELKNGSPSSKRFATQPVAVELGQTYNITFYAKGQGEIGTRIYTNKYVGSINYTDINTNNWEQFEASVTADTVVSDAEFLFYVKNTVAASGHVQIDQVTITESSTATVSIYDIQNTTSGPSSYVGQTVKTQGIVTAVNSTGRFFIQDGSGAWNGVYVYDNNFEVEVGDQVNITATVDEFKDLTELTGVVILDIVSSGNQLPAPAVISTQEANNEMYEGVLVKVNNAAVVSPENNGKWDINDGSGKLVVSDFMNRDSFMLTENESYDITGIMDYFNNYQLLPRDISDVTVTGIEEYNNNVVNAYPNPAQSTLFFTVDLNSSIAEITITNMFGQAVNTVKPNINKASISVEDLSNGIYLYTAKDMQGNVLSTNKFVVAK